MLHFGRSRQCRRFITVGSRAATLGFTTCPGQEFTLCYGKIIIATVAPVIVRSITARTVVFDSILKMLDFVYRQEPFTAAMTRARCRSNVSDATRNEAVMANVLISQSATNHDDDEGSERIFIR